MRKAILKTGIDKYLIEVLIYLHENDVKREDILQRLFSIISKLMAG